MNSHATLIAEIAKLKAEIVAADNMIAQIQMENLGMVDALKDELAEQEEGLAEARELIDEAPRVHAKWVHIKPRDANYAAWAEWREGRQKWLSKHKEAKM